MDNAELLQLCLFYGKALVVGYIGGFDFCYLCADVFQLRERSFIIPQSDNGVFVVYDFALMLFAETVFEKLGFVFRVLLVNGSGAVVLFRRVCVWASLKSYAV